MRDHARSLAYLELAHLWRRPQQLGRRWCSYRRARLLALITAAGYGELAQAESRRLATAPGESTPAPATGEMPWQPVESRYRLPGTDPARAYAPTTAPFLSPHPAAYMLSLLVHWDRTLPPEVAGHPDHLAVELAVMGFVAVEQAALGGALRFHAPGS